MKEARVIKKSDAVVQAFDWGALHWFASGQMGNSEKMTIGKCVIKPGCQNPRHEHPSCEEVLHVLSGTISHSVGKDTFFEMHPGDTIAVPPGVVHNAKNIGKDDAVLMIAFSSPNRETKGE